MAGLTLGCLNACHWVSKEDQAMLDKKDNDDSTGQRVYGLDERGAGGCRAGRFFWAGLWWTLRSAAFLPIPVRWQIAIQLALNAALSDTDRGTQDRAPITL